MSKTVLIYLKFVNSPANSPVVQLCGVSGRCPSKSVVCVFVCVWLRVKAYVFVCSVRSVSDDTVSLFLTSKAPEFSLRLRNITQPDTIISNFPPLEAFMP